MSAGDMVEKMKIVGARFDGARKLYFEDRKAWADISDDGDEPWSDCV